MTAAQGSRWSFAVEGIKEIRIELRNADLRIYRTDAADVEIYVNDDAEISELLQVERGDRELSIVQKGIGWRGPSPHGFGFEGTIEATVQEAIGEAFGAFETLMETFGEGFPGPRREEGRHADRPSRHSAATIQVSVGLPASLEMPTVAAHLDRGAIEIADLWGELSLRTGMGAISLSRCGRTCAAKTGRGEVTARDCSGRLELHTGMGAMHLTACEGSAQLHSGKGTIQLEGCRLEGSCHTGHGDLRLESVRGSGIYRTGAGTITALRPEADELELHTGKGEIVVRGGGAERLRAHSGAGSLRISDFRRIGRLELHTGMGAITAEGGTVDWLNMRGGAGNLTCAVALGPGEHALETGAGNIEVRLPDDARVRIDAVTRMGSVHSDFGLVKVGRPGPVTIGSGRFVGSIGEGEATSTLHIKTSAGNIAIRRVSERGAAEESTGHVHAAASPRGQEPAPRAEGGHMAREQTRLEVLHSLQRGEITVEEAMALLERNG